MKDKLEEANQRLLRKRKELEQTKKTITKDYKSLYCPKHKIKKEPIGKEPFVLSICAKCIEESKNMQDTKEISEGFKEDIYVRLGRSNIPKLYLHRDFECNTEKQILAKKRAYEIIDPSTRKDNAIFLGKLGTGKTLLACCVAKQYIRETSYTALYSVFFDIVLNIKETWNTRTSTLDVIEKYVTPDLLIIDELGLGYGSHTEFIYISRIIDKRYSECKKTILCGNVTPRETEDIIGDRAYRRINENSNIVIFDWERFIPLCNK